MYQKDKTKVISVRVSEETYNILTQIKNQFGITPSMLCRQVFDGIKNGYSITESGAKNVNEKIKQ